MARQSEAARRRQQAAERAELIAELGWPPEDGTVAGRYVATTGELWQLVQQRKSA